MTKAKGFLVSLPWSLDYAGGVNQVVKHLSAELKKDGYPVLLHENSYRSQKQSDPDGIIVKPLPAYPTSPKSKLLHRFLKQPMALQQWTRIIQENQIGYIHVHYPVLSCHFFQSLKAKTHIKLICSLHGKDITDIKAEPSYRKKWSDFFTSCDLVTTCSAHLKAQFLEIYPAQESKTLVLHNGVDLENMKQERETTPSITLPKSPYIVNVATYEYKKGQDILLKGFAMYCANSSDTNLQLVFAGRKGVFLQELEALANELGVSDRVKFLINLSHQDAIQLIDHATCFALPSRAEPFGIVLLEAGYCETPVIAHAVGGITEFLQHQINSVLIENNTAEAWSAELNELMNNEKQRHQISEQLNRDVKQNFGWDRVYQKLRAAMI